jgi:hypothetical protein
MSWECAELLIELGGGGGGGGGEQVTPMTSVSAPVIQHLVREGEGEGLKGREREKAVTLLLDDGAEHSTTPLPSSTLPSSAIISASTSGGSNIASSSGSTGDSGPPSTSWREGSTGRHDLSQRQLVLLREMLNVGVVIVGDDNDGGGNGDGDGDGKGQPVGQDDLRPPIFVNRDWRWGDAMNSTVTLSEEQYQGERKMEKEKAKKRKSGRLGMSGIRDLLRSLKKNHDVEESQIGTSNVDGQHQHGRLPAVVALTQQPMTHSSTSLSTQSSVGVQQQQQQQRLPIVQRRGRSSTGPESMKGGRPTLFHAPSSYTTTTTTTTTSKSSPRRPSLASIFRIGNSNNKMRPVSSGGGTPGVVEDPSSSTGASAHDLAVAPAATTPGSSAGTGGEDSNNSTCEEEEEEDWDRMDIDSDLDANKALDVGGDRGGTVRGRMKKNNKKVDENKKQTSPYLQQGVSSLNGSGVSSGLGGFLARHSIIPKRSFSASQSSIWGTGGGGGGGDVQPYPVNVPRRDAQPSERIISAPIASTSSTRPSSPRLLPSKFAKNVKNTGSVRSMPAHHLPDSTRHKYAMMMMTPENIRPLLDNAKEVYGKLLECVVEMRELVGDVVATA